MRLVSALLWLLLIVTSWDPETRIAVAHMPMHNITVTFKAASKVKAKILKIGEAVHARLGVDTTLQIKDEVFYITDLRFDGED